MRLALNELQAVIRIYGITITDEEIANIQKENASLSPILSEKVEYPTVIKFITEYDIGDKKFKLLAFFGKNRSADTSVPLILLENEIRLTKESPYAFSTDTYINTYYDANKLFVIDGTTRLDPETLRSALKYFNIATNNDPSFLFKTRNNPKICTDEETYQMWFKDNFYGLRMVKNTYRNGLIVMERFVKTMFDKPLEQVFPNLKGLLDKSKKLKDYSAPPLFISEIIDVYEDPDTGERHFITLQRINNKAHDAVALEDFVYSVNAAKHSHEHWQLVDQGRKLLYNNVVDGISVCYRYSEGLNNGFVTNSPMTESYYKPFTNCKIIFTDDEPVFSPTIEPYYDFLKGRFTTVLANDLEASKILKRYTVKRLKIEQQEKEKKLIEDKLSKKLAVIKENEDETFVVNEVTISKHTIEYIGQKLSCKSFTGVDVYQTAKGLYRQGAVNFETLFDTFIEYVRQTARTKNDTEITGTIGSVPFSFKSIIRENSAGSSFERTYINGFRINNDEALSILRHTLCFNDLATFNTFVSGVSKCSLRIHNYLHYGIKVSVYDDLLRTNLRMRFKLVRNKNTHFIEDGKKVLHKVKDLNALLRLVNKRTLKDVAIVLSNPDIIEDGISVDIGALLKASMAAYTEAVEKSKKMLEDVCNMLGTKLEEKVIRGSRKKGYKIEGKLRNYFLEHSVRGDVYNYDTGGYICVVEKNGSHDIDPSDQVGADKLVNRMLALRNDDRVVQYVRTLK